MFDQLMIGNRSSFDDFDASIASRAIGWPKKKEIKETVPFSNMTYDFSAINGGEVYWEQRELRYDFEITAENAEDLEFKKTRFAAWVANVMEERLYDPYDPDYFYVATFANLSYTDDESLEKTVVTVYFSAYPYKVARAESKVNARILSGKSRTLRVNNDSAHPIKPTITTNQLIELTLNGDVYQITEGVASDEMLKLPVGESDITVKNLGADVCQFELTFTKEAL